MSDSEEASSTATLPDGWTKHVDDNGANYYRHDETDKEQGKRPTGPISTKRNDTQTPTKYDKVSTLETDQRTATVAEEESDDEQDNESGCKCKAIYGIIFQYGVFGIIITVAMGMCIGCIVYGSIAIQSAREYSQNATEETCKILSISVTDCQYDCSDIDDDTSYSCDDFEYDYTAIAPDRCGNKVLYYSWDKNDCPGIKKTMDEPNEHKCYVLDCDEAEFTFKHFSENMVPGVFALVIGSIAGLAIPICICKRTNCCRDKEECCF